MVFKKSHDDWCSNIIRQIGNHLDRLTPIFLLCQRRNINFQDILVNNSHIIPVFQSIIFQNRDQCLINLYSHHFSGCLSQILGHGSNARSDFQNKIILGNLGSLDYFFQNMGIDKKILTKPFLESKIILLKNFNGIFRIS